MTVHPAIRLAETYLLDLALDRSESGAPVERHGRSDVERSRDYPNPGTSDSLDADSISFPPFLTLLEDLREREENLVRWGNVILEPAHIVQIITVDDNGQLTSRVGAEITNDESACVAIPIDAPLDMPALNLTRGLFGLDRVRVLGEIVRILGDAVRRIGLDQSVLSDLARLLRTAISEYERESRQGQSETGNQEGPIHTEPSHTSNGEEA